MLIEVVFLIIENVSHALHLHDQLLESFEYLKPNNFDLITSDKMDKSRKREVLYLAPVSQQTNVDEVAIAGAFLLVFFNFIRKCCQLCVLREMEHIYIAYELFEASSVVF